MESDQQKRGQSGSSFSWLLALVWRERYSPLCKVSIEFWFRPEHGNERVKKPGADLTPLTLGIIDGYLALPQQTQQFSGLTVLI